MAVELGDYVDDFRVVLSPPGDDLFPNMGDTEAIDRLRNGFWSAVLDQIISGYTESDGVITPKDANGTDITREFIQLVILYASIDAVGAAMRNGQTMLRAQAGPVEYEVQNSANLLRDMFADLTGRRDYLLKYLVTTTLINPIAVDMVMARTYSIAYGGTWFLSGEQGYSYGYGRGC